MDSSDHDQLYSIAENQAGYFTAVQAREKGFSWKRLSYYAKTGMFQRVAHGVYRLTRFPISPFEDLFVAWLRTSPGSAISHGSALMVYELSDVLPAEIHVTIPRNASRRRKGIRLHTNKLESENIVWREGLPVTSVSRTISDVARAGLSDELVEQAIRQALNRGLVSHGSLRDEAAKRGGRAAKVILNVLSEDTQ